MRKNTPSISLLGFLLLHGGIALALAALVAPMPHGVRLLGADRAGPALRLVVLAMGLACAATGWAVRRRLRAGFHLLCTGCALALCHAALDPSAGALLGALLDGAVLALLLHHRQAFDRPLDAVALPGAQRIASLLAPPAPRRRPAPLPVITVKNLRSFAPLAPCGAGRLRTARS